MSIFTPRIVNITHTLLPLEVVLDVRDHVGLGLLLALFVLLHPLDVPRQAYLLPVHDPLLVVQSRDPSRRFILQAPDCGASCR